MPPSSAQYVRCWRRKSTCCTAFEDFRVPLLVVTTDFNPGRPVVFRSGPLAQPLLTSAIPGLSRR